jgi:hypothetical protein
VGQTYEGIDERWREWISRQPLFFVGTAALTGDGHVNVSPKGPGAYVDYQRENAQSIDGLPAVEIG